jgi:YHS domain-containing protein
VQDPEIQLQELGIAIPDLLDPKKPAVLDVAHRSFVNYETFFFSDEADKRRFDADPTGSCGVLTDPVTKERFRPGSDAPRGEFGGRTYFFLTASNKETFEKSPETYALPNYDMIEVPGMR